MGDLYSYRTHGGRDAEGVRPRTWNGGGNPNWLVEAPKLPPPPPFNDDKITKTKKKAGGSGSSIMKSWNDPEMKRKRRVASYKAYAVEGKVKASLKKSIRWIKLKCSEIIHGW